MRVLFFGSGEFAVPTLRSIQHDGHDVLAVVTQPDRAKGRGQDLSPTPVKREAAALGLAVLCPADVNDARVVAQLTSLGADLAYVAAFGQKIGKELLNAFPVGIINLHASLLPAFRGAAPIQRAIMNGCGETGVTIFRLVEKMDAGPILLQRRTTIGDCETAQELHDRLARIGCDAVREALALLATNPSAPGTPQDDAKATNAPKLTKADGHISFDQPASSVAAAICGLWPWPGAACLFHSIDGRREERVTLARARDCEIAAPALELSQATGTINELMRVRAKDGEVELLEIKPAGGKLMEWQAFVNGRHVAPGDRFWPVESA